MMGKTRTRKKRSRAKKGGGMTPLKAAKVVHTFMKKTEFKRKARFLSSICSDSGVCISFGTEIDKINKFFNNYTDFKYAVYPVKQIGIPSANGFIKEIKYERENYEAYAILKSSVHERADNLMYEYEVGKFLNEQTKVFPCFVETYGLFLHVNEDPWKFLKNSALNPPSDIISNLQLMDVIDYKVGCAKSKYIAILIQHIKNALDFTSFIKNSLFESDLVKKKSAINWDMPCILYQIYFALSTLKDKFTHYDLHPGNVQLYEPVKGSYITYNYHLKSGDVVRFNSKYIAKIIDFGRSYYYQGAGHNSKNTYDHLCQTVPFCGANCGLQLLNTTYSRDHLTPQVKNESSDLRLLYILRSYMRKGYLGKTATDSIEHDFSVFLEKIVFKGLYGTPEIKHNGLNNNNNTQTSNVTDALHELNELFKNPSITKYQDAYIEELKLTKLGEFHIYEDRPMTFHSSKKNSTPDNNRTRHRSQPTTSNSLQSITFTSNGLSNFRSQPTSNSLQSLTPTPNGLSNFRSQPTSNSLPSLTPTPKGLSQHSLQSQTPKPNRQVSSYSELANNWFNFKFSP